MPHHWKQQNQTNFAGKGISPLLQYNLVDKCKVDFVGKIENFADDLRTVVEKLNLLCSERSIAHQFQYSDLRLNASTRRYLNIDDYYTAETKAKVYSAVKKDFSYFGYEK